MKKLIANPISISTAVAIAGTVGYFHFSESVLAGNPAVLEQQISAVYQSQGAEFVYVPKSRGAALLSAIAAAGGFANAGLAIAGIGSSKVAQKTTEQTTHVKTSVTLPPPLPLRPVAIAQPDPFTTDEEEHEEEIEEEEPEEEIKEEVEEIGGEWLSVPLNDEVSWVPSKQGNGFLLILGGSGFGKTQSMKAIAAEIDNFGIPVPFIDYKGDIDVPFEEIQFTYENTSGCINPLRITCTDPRFGGLDQHIAKLMLRLERLCGVGHKQRRYLKAALLECYRQKGINDNPDTWENQAPILKDVLRSLQDELYANMPVGEDKGNPSAVASIEGLIAMLEYVFESPIFNGEEIDPTIFFQKSYRLNISFLDDNIKNLAGRTILEQIMQIARERGPIPEKPSGDHEVFRVIPMVDEAKFLTNDGKNRDDPFSEVNNICTVYRGYGMGLILGSQRPDHFSQEAKSQIATYLCHSSRSPDELAEFSRATGIPLSSLKALNQRGRALFRDSSGVREVQVKMLCDRPYLGKAEEKAIASDNVIKFKRRA